MAKNRVEARRAGNLVELRIVFSDEAQADKFFDLIEAFGVAAVRVDLEREWREWNEEGDRS